jgi:hypothetical protein
MSISAMLLKDTCHSIDSPELSSTWKISSFLWVAQEHVNDSPFPNLSSYDGISTQQDQSGGSLDQRGAQYRRLDW